MGLIATMSKKDKKDIPSLAELIQMGNHKTARNILITGGAGFIGSHVVRLFARNIPITGFTTSTS